MASNTPWAPVHTCCSLINYLPDSCALYHDAYDTMGTLHVHTSSITGISDAHMYVTRTVITRHSISILSYSITVDHSNVYCAVHRVLPSADQSWRVLCTIAIICSIDELVHLFINSICIHHPSQHVLLVYSCGTVPTLWYAFLQLRLSRFSN